MQRNKFNIGIAGLGAVGLNVARRLEEGIPGLALTAIAVRDRDKARRNLPGAGERINLTFRYVKPSPGGLQKAH